MKQLIFILLLAFGAYSQNFEWVKSMGNFQNDYGYAIATDNNGNVYTAGMHGADTIDFDPGPGVFNIPISAGGLFIQKLDANGNFIWAKGFGGPGPDVITSIYVDDNENVYTTGSFINTADFDPGLGVYSFTSALGVFNSPSNDIFIQKLDANGDFLWARAFGDYANDSGVSIVVDYVGSVYITGQYADTVDFDPGIGVSNLISAGGQSDIYVLKLNSDGNFLWVKGFDGMAGNDTGRSIDVDADGNVYTTGNFQGTVDFDPGPGTSIHSPLGIQEAYLHKMNSNGDFIWVKTFGGVSAAAIGTSISVGASGNLFLTGRYEESVDFDPNVGVANVTSNGGLDVFTSKLDSLGNLIWVRSFGGTGHDWGENNALDDDENVYITGFFWETVDFDPGVGTDIHTSNNVNDAYISKLDSSGLFVWAGTFGGVANVQGRSIAVDLNNSIYSAGHFEQVVDFDPGPGVTSLNSPNNNYDIYVHKMNQCISASDTQYVNACESYEWIDGNTYTSSTNTPTWVIPFAAGCDSTITLDLTINPLPDTNLITSGSSLTADIFADGYQWLDCDNNYAALPGETNQTFTPQTVGNYAVEITLNGCTDTSSCYYFNNAGLATEGLNNEPEIIKVVDLLGRETPEKPNITLIYIYSDGTTERVYQLE